MGASNRVRALNIILRVATLASRFFLVFFLARFFEPAQLGLYGLITVTIGYSLYLVGFDFYTFTTREFLKHERHELGGLLKDQGVLTIILYAIFTPLLSLIFIKGLLPSEFFGWFFVLLVLEHLNQELGRLLIAISEQLWASVVLFLRHGTWAIGVTVLMAIEPATRSLDYVFGAWILAGAIAICAGVCRLAQLGVAGWRNEINWKWISTGLKVSVSLLVATLAIRGVFTLDRYWLKALVGLEIVGAYVLFTGVSGTLMAFLDAGIFSFSYPNLINAYQKKDSELFYKGMRTLFFQTTILSVVFSIISLLMILPLLEWLGNPLYVANQNLYPWVLAPIIISAFSMVPHYGLYAQRLDRPIVNSHIASFFLFVISTWLFSEHFPLLAVPLGLCSATILILIWKLWAFFRLTPVQYRSAKI